MGGEIAKTINRANALMSQFWREHQGCHLEEAIVLRRRVLEYVPEPHIYRPQGLGHLATSSVERYRSGGPSNDLDEAVCLYGEAISLDFQPEVDRSDYLNDLANVFAMGFDRDGDYNDLQEAMKYNKQALQL